MSNDKESVLSLPTFILVLGIFATVVMGSKTEEVRPPAKDEVDVVQPVEPEAVPDPIPDPGISEPQDVPQAEISFFDESITSTPAGYNGNTVICVGMPTCGPCLRMKEDFADLFGDVVGESPLVYMEYNEFQWRQYYKKEISSVPFYIVVDGSDSPPTRSGYSTPQDFSAWASSPAFQVSLAYTPSEPVTQTRTTAQVYDAPNTPANISEVLARHLLRQSGDESLVGSSLDVVVDDSADLYSIVRSLMASQTWSGQDTTIEWKGERNLKLSQNRVDISPPMKVTYQKWFMTLGCKLSAIETKKNSVLLILDGAPDLEVIFE